METQGTAKPGQTGATGQEPGTTNATGANAQAAQHVAEAHEILKGLRGEQNRHPQLEEAIEKLEMALAILTVRSGGLL